MKRLFLEEHSFEHGCVITQQMDDFIKPLSARPGQERVELQSSIPALPAPVACYWLSGEAVAAAITCQVNAGGAVLSHDTECRPLPVRIVRALQRMP